MSPETVEYRGHSIISGILAHEFVVRRTGTRDTLFSARNLEEARAIIDARLESASTVFVVIEAIDTAVSVTHIYTDRTRAEEYAKSLNHGSAVTDAVLYAN